MPTTRLTIPRYLDDLLVLAARVTVGIVLVAHGWQKFSQAGWTGPAEGFAGMGVPMPEIAAPLAMYAELICGVLLVAGFLTAPAALAMAIQMGVALYFVHLANGLFVTDGGWELVGVIGAACLLLAAYGPGRLSVDAIMWPDRLTSRTARKDAKAAEKARQERLAAEATGAGAAGAGAKGAAARSDRDGKRDERRDAERRDGDRRGVEARDARRDADRRDADRRDTERRPVGSRDERRPLDGREDRRPGDARTTEDRYRADRADRPREDRRSEELRSEDRLRSDRPVDPADETRRPRD